MSSVVKVFLKNTKILFLLVFILIINLYLKIGNLGYTYNTDGQMSYIVAYNIAKYGEPIMVGPANSGFKSWKNAPLYYWILAGFLKINDGILFLAFINIILQAVTALSVSLIAALMYGNLIGLVAMILFSFSQFNIDQSIFYIWQPWLMQPFINLSFLLLLYSYLKKSFLLLLVSSVLFIISIALHNSVLSLTPLYLISCFLILRNQKQAFKHYLFLALTMIVTLIFLFLPLFIYWNKYSIDVLTSVRKESTLSLLTFFGNLKQAFSSFINTFFISINPLSQNINLLLILVIILGIFYIFRTKHTKQVKILTLFLLLFIIQPLLFVSFMNLDQPSLKQSIYIYGLPRYFTAILGLVSILIAAIVGLIFRGNLSLKIIKLSLIILLINACSPNLIYLLSKSKGFNNLNLDPKIKMIDSVKTELLSMKSKDNIKEFNFFQTRSLSSGAYDALIWGPLQKQFNTKLTKNTDSTPANYEQITSDKYLLLICSKWSGPNPQTCLDSLLKSSGSSYLRNIYEDSEISVSLSKK